MTLHEDSTALTGTEVFFCDPYSPSRLEMNASASTNLLPKPAPQTTKETHRSPRSNSIVAAHNH